MSASPGDSRYPFESPENKDGKPLYPNTDSFLPLGFSTPQQHRNSGPSSHSRNYYSAQPKYMLPRQRGFHNKNRNAHYQQQSNKSGSPADNEEPPPTERRNFHNRRDWQGRNFNQRSHNNQRYHHQNPRNNRFGFGHNQGKDNNGKYNINDYFHPSMLEDPWFQLEQQKERTKIEDGNSSESPGGGAGGDGSEGSEE
ncbi:GATA zinc finger domain-containing protein 14 [Armigeres subalbatus]|uniref:GATA zinc finger domain-containing protein 14 n=1 Tax=Armigeres subalbatus TaxID=124917 RepID=UPI002ED1AA94